MITRLRFIEIQYYTNDMENALEWKRSGAFFILNTIFKARNYWLFWNLKKVMTNHLSPLGNSSKNLILEISWWSTWLWR